MVGFFFVHLKMPNNPYVRLYARTNTGLNLSTSSILMKHWFFLSRSCSMAILDFYQLRRKQRSTDPKTTFLTTIIPTDVLLCLIKHFMKVEGNNEILLKTLKSLQKHYIRIEIYRLMSSQTKISSLELYSTFLQNYKSCRKKMKR